MLKPELLKIEGVGKSSFEMNVLGIKLELVVSFSIVESSVFLEI